MYGRKTMKNVIRYAIFLLTASIMFAQGNSKLASDLQNLDPGATVDVIVQFHQAPSQADFDNVRGQGGELKNGLPVIQGGLFSVPAAALQGLANNPAIRFISPDRDVNAALDYSQPTVYADMAQDLGWNGQGSGVAIIDSGVHRQHLDLKQPATRVVYEENFHPHATNTADEYGHGSHVAGLMAGNGTSPNLQGITDGGNGLSGVQTLDKASGFTELQGIVRSMGMVANTATGGGQAMASLIVLDTIRWYSYMETKTTDGWFLFGLGATQPSLFGVPVAMHDGIPQHNSKDQICIGDFQKFCHLRDRQAAQVRVESRHRVSSSVTVPTGQVSLVADCRAAMIWERPAAFVLFQEL